MDWSGLRLAACHTATLNVHMVRWQPIFLIIRRNSPFLRIPLVIQVSVNSFTGWYEHVLFAALQPELPQKCTVALSAQTAEVGSRFSRFTSKRRQKTFWSTQHSIRKCGELLRQYDTSFHTQQSLLELLTLHEGATSAREMEEIAEDNSAAAGADHQIYNNAQAADNRQRPRLLQ